MLAVLYKFIAVMGVALPSVSSPAMLASPVLSRVGAV
jgi:hypothetical protein